MIVAVTGATGYLGRFIVSELVRNGDTVRAWYRTTSDRTGFSDGIEWVEGDLANANSIRTLVKGAEAVIHAAFDHIPDRYRGGEGEQLNTFLEKNLMGSLRLIEEAYQHHVTHFVLLSSRAVYGRCNQNQALDENHPVFPDTHYGAYKAALENFVSSWGKSKCWSINALRITGVYGVRHPFERSKWVNLIRSVLAGNALRTNHEGTEVHGSDVAKAVRLLLAHPDVHGQIFNCSDFYMHERDLIFLIQQLAGKQNSIPNASPPGGFGVMETHALRNLGMQFGGRQLLEATIQEMIERIKQ